ncbi:MAG: DUF2309 domain-containing protein [Actinomycetota bacterium]
MTLLIRAKVAQAAHDIAPSWPLESFIAINPLAGEEGRPFEHAAGAARLTRTSSEFLSDYRSGRITDADLVAAVTERVPELGGATPALQARLRIGGRTLRAAEIVAAELPFLQPPVSVPAGTPSLVDRVDRLAAKWVAAYLDPDPLWCVPDRAAGFYGAWRRLARYDTDVPFRARRGLRSLPERADDALDRAIVSLGIPESEIERAMKAELAGLPGWAAHIKWRAEHAGDIDLTSYLAVRFTLRVALGEPISTRAQPNEVQLGTEPPATVWTRGERLVRHLGGGASIERQTVAALARLLATHPQNDHPFTWQRAYELHYRDALLASLTDGAQDTDRPVVQVVMCIDPRSEGLRRHLERGTAIETLGFAGFFGVPIRYLGHGAREAVNSLPALLSPRHTVTDLPRDGRTATRRTARLRLRDALASGLHAGDTVAAAPFALAETAGWFFGIGTLVRTVFPAAAGALSRLGSATLPPLPSTMTVSDAFTLEERAQLAETAIRMMGVNRFAPLIVLAGHGSTSSNNLYQSALDCGACGGNPGAPNARAAAAIFNDFEVRSILAFRGIPIPSETFFVAAEHDTVSDRIAILDPHLVPATHLAAVRQFEKMQRDAADRLITERAADLPGASPRHSPARLRRRAHDWAEVYPELGLAGNAAMILGPRELTRGVDLGRRVFLHSYRSELDPDGGALESILTAPVVVAQWINHQYYFSALNPDQLGAGTKTVHNAIGTLGVLSGQGGDLRRGLPWQSVGFGEELFHEPMRLAVIAQAPLDRIGEIVSRNQVLRSLLDNDWITLTARTNPTMGWQRYTRYGWSPLKRLSPTPEGAVK